MDANPKPIPLTDEQSKVLSALAGEVFTPRTPISDRELFAGRWTEINQLVDTVNQVGLHVVLYGERGVGKTSLANVIPFLLTYFDAKANPPRKANRIAIRSNANSTDTFSTMWAKVLDEISWSDDAPSIGFRPQVGKKITRLREAFGLDGDLSIEDVRRVISNLPDSVFVIDEFDRMPKKHTSQFTDLIKALADSAARTTIMLVGVSETVEGLVRDHASIPRALIQIPLKPMKLKDLREILENGEKKLGVVFELRAGERIAMMSQGRPHYTHLVGLLSVRAALARHSGVVSAADVAKGFEQAVKSADHTISKLYADATHSAHKGALWEQVLLACAIAAAKETDEFGHFQPVSVVEPLTAILRRDRPVAISTFNSHLAEFCEDKRGILARSGHPRAYRYRFRDSLIAPYVLMRGVADNMISAESLAAFLDSPIAISSGSEQPS